MQRGDRLWFQLSAHPCFAFCPLTHAAVDSVLCFALDLEGQHSIVLPTSRRCTHYKRWVSLPKPDSRAVSYQGRTTHWFPLCAFKAGTLTAGLKCQSSTLPARAPRKSLDASAGAQLYWLLLLQKEVPPCLLPSPQKGYLAAAFQPVFLSFLLISPLWKILHDLLCNAPACTGYTVPADGANPQSPVQVSFHSRFLQHGLYTIILKPLLHDLWEMWLILEKMLLKLNSHMTLLTYCWKPAVPCLHISFLSWH